MSDETITMRVNVKLPYNVPAREVPQDQDVIPQEMTYNYITVAVNQKYKDGLASQWRRTWSSIQRKLDKAIEDKDESVEFVKTEFDFIKAATTDENIKIPQAYSKYFVVLEDEIDRVSDNFRKKNEAKEDKEDKKVKEDKK